MESTVKARAIAWLAAAILAGGCASYSGSNLVPGTSTAGEVEKSMGRPKLKLPGKGGEAVWYYPRGPLGWHTYAVTVGPDGVMRGIEQRLTVENVKKIVPDKTTKQEVLALLGPPKDIAWMPLKPREVWEYQFLEIAYKWQLFVQFSEDGVVREVLQMPHPEELRPDSGNDFK